MPCFRFPNSIAQERFSDFHWGLGFTIKKQLYSGTFTLRLVWQHLIHLLNSFLHWLKAGRKRLLVWMSSFDSGVELIACLSHLLAKLFQIFGSFRHNVGLDLLRICSPQHEMIQMTEPLTHVPAEDPYPISQQEERLFWSILTVGPLTVVLKNRLEFPLQI